jgi:hypothetical protein
MRNMILKFVIYPQVLNRDTNAADMRGKHENHKKIQEQVLEDLHKFLKSLEGRESHYSRPKNGQRKYLDSNMNISKLHKKFLQEMPKYDPNAAQFEGFEVKYYLMVKLFNYEYNLSFGFPRSDICETCEHLDVEIKGIQNQPDGLEQLDALDNAYLRQQEHLIEADGFYQSMKRHVLTALPQNEFCITFDYEKNLPLPVTSTSAEYFLSQLWIYNFCIHDLRSSKAHMFVYSEHFAAKSSNEVVSCLKYYIENVIPPQTEVLRIWADNAYGQNKNRYVLAYLLSSVYVPLEKTFYQSLNLESEEEPESVPGFVDLDEEIALALVPLPQNDDSDLDSNITALSLLSL